LFFVKKKKEKHGRTVILGYMSLPGHPESRLDN